MTGCKPWYEVLCCPFPLNWWKRLWTRRSPPLPSTVALFRSLGALYLLVLLFPMAPSTSASGWEGWSLAVVSTIRAAQAHAGSQHGLFWVPHRRPLETTAGQGEEKVPGALVFWWSGGTHRRGTTWILAAPTGRNEAEKQLDVTGWRECWPPDLATQAVWKLAQDDKWI